MCLCVLSWWHVGCDVGLHWNVLVHYGLVPRPVAGVGAPASFPDHGERTGIRTAHIQFSGWSSFQNFNACYNIAKINLSHMTNQMCVLKTITVLYGKFIWAVQRWWFCVRGGC